MDIINYIRNKPINRLKRAGTKLALFSDSIGGSRYSVLSPRTLPNGIKNSDTIQRVSGDVVLTGANFDQRTDGESVGWNIDAYRIVTLPNQNTSIVAGSMVTGKASFLFSEFPYTDRATITTEGFRWYVGNTGVLLISTPKGQFTTLADFQAYVNANPQLFTMSYQLATPIDTLNTPPPTPWVDLANNVGKNLFDSTQPHFALVGTTLVNTGNSITVTATSATAYRYVRYKLYGLTAGATMYLKMNSSRTGVAGGGAGVYRSDTSLITGDTNSLNPSFTFVIPADGIIEIGLFATSATAEATSATFSNIMLSYTNIPYEPYAKNNALMQGLANTSDSGMAYVPLVCETGTPVEYANLVTNGDFANGTTGWDVGGQGTGTLTVSGGKATATGNGTSSILNVIQPLNPVPSMPNGNRWLLTAKVKVLTAGATSLKMQLRSSGISDTAVIANPVVGTEYLLSGIVTSLGDYVSPYARVVASYPDTATQSGKQIEVDNFMLTPITANTQIAALESQMPNPLTALECDRLFPFVATSGVSKIGLRPLMVFDGINDYGLLANNPSVDIVGTGDFAIAVGFLTPSVMNNNQIICKNLDSAANIQYSINSLLDGQIIVYLNVTPIQVVGFGQVLPNNMYDLRIYRINGRLIAKLQNVEKSNQANTTALLSQPNLRLGARSSIADGSTNTAFFKGGLAWAIIATGAEVANLDKALDRKARDYRLVG